MVRLTPSHFDRETGFSLVELLIVTCVLGIIASIAIPQVVMPSLEAKEAVLVQNLASLRKAIEIYALQHNGVFPTPPSSNIEAQLTGKTDKNGNPGTEYGPYLREIPRNPINNLTTIEDVKIPHSPKDDSGWYYDEDTGEIRANSSGTAPSGIDYIDL